MLTKEGALLRRVCLPAHILLPAAAVRRARPLPDPGGGELCAGLRSSSRAAADPANGGFAGLARALLRGDLMMRPD